MQAAGGPWWQQTKRSAAWAGAGVCLSPVVGAPLWLVTGDGPIGSVMPLGVAVVGGVAGLVLMRWGPPALRAHGALIFSLAYPAIFGWWLFVAGTRGGLVLLLLAVGVASIGVVARRWDTGPTKGKWEAKKALAALTWTAAVLSLPIMLVGVVLIPLAAALTALARQAALEFKSPSRSDEVAASAAS